MNPAAQLRARSRAEACHAVAIIAAGLTVTWLILNATNGHWRALVASLVLLLAREVQASPLPTYAPPRGMAWEIDPSDEDGENP